MDFEALLTYKPIDQGGRTTKAITGYRPHIEFDHIPGFLTSGAQRFLDQEEVDAGEIVKAEIAIATYYGIVGNLNLDDTFTFSEGKNVIGTGRITNIFNKNLLNVYSQKQVNNLIIRLESAIKFAHINKVLLVQNIKISIDSNKDLIITGFSKSQNFDMISKKSALLEINELKNTYSHWIGIIPSFKNFRNYINPTFVLSYMESKNGFGICMANKDGITWLIEL
ncbi:hypothetical protein [Nonlabens ulvanivorans]|uniref:hypothetical protein n=1 Tax=Nonlabens ulvanivorans TaxID=906888 RepID=UPI003265630C